MEDTVPLPTDSRLSFSEMHHRATVACKTQKLVLAGLSLPEGASRELRAATSEMLSHIAENRSLPDPFATKPGAAYVKRILEEYDVDVIDGPDQIRKFVTNKLIVEADNNDPRVRIKALELLGKVSDVGLFTERSEVTVNNRSTIELENTLKDKLRRLMGAEEPEDAKYVENDE